MLKPRRCYASAELFSRAFWRNYASVDMYALSPFHGTYVKFLYPNDTVKHLDDKPRFFFVTKDGKSRDFYEQDAHDILSFIQIARDGNLKDLKTVGGMVEFDTAPNGRAKYLYVRVRGVLSKLYSNVDIAVNREEAEEVQKGRWITLCNRMESIMQAFLMRAIADQPSTVTKSFTMSNFTMIPLNNAHAGPDKRSYLRLQNRSGAKWASINFNHDDMCIHLSGSVQWSSHVTDVVESFIGGMENIIKDFHSHVSKKLGDKRFSDEMYIGSKTLDINDIRSRFMEYVAGREAGGESHEGSYRSLLITLNSDVAPGGSKVWFHYHPIFMKDLFEGLRELANQVEK